LPPTITDGCGFWTGFDQDQIRSKRTNSAWYDAFSSV